MIEPNKMTLDLSACDKEPIHAIGSIQPHGALLVLSEPALEVVQASANSASLLHFTQGQVVGAPAEKLFSEPSIVQIKKILSQHQSGDFSPSLPFWITPKQLQKPLRGYMHRHEGACILELEPAAVIIEDQSALEQWIAVDLLQLLESATVPDLLEVTAKQIQDICNFDRVLIYQFDRDWHGTVVAEHRGKLMPSFLGHRFPASDIPSQARLLYTKNKIRLLVDVDAWPSAVTPTDNPVTGRPLDLTYSLLRSMSPVHIEYLKNMGVRASMSISLMVRNKLWGLIVCHHTTAKLVDFAGRARCELIAKVVANLVENIEQHEIIREKLRLGLEHDKIIIKLSRADSVVQGLCDQLSDLVLLTNASGAALLGDGILELFGITPAKQLVQEFYFWLRDTMQELIFCSDRLPLDHPQWSKLAVQASGTMAINISAINHLWILWFRREQIEEVLWAGNPYKPVDLDANQAILHPRQSFEVWAEEVRGRSQPWKSFELEVARSIQSQIFHLTLSEIRRNAKTNKALREQREDMFAILAHDLNVPVVAMDRVLQSLVAEKTNNVPQELRETLRVLASANHAQGERIQKILKVLRYELGSVGLNAEPIDCAKLIGESIAEIVLLPGQGPSISTTIEEDNNIFTSDRESVKRLIVNVIDNAVRAAGSAGTVQVACHCSAGGLSIKIKDNGPGIAAEDQADLFNRFWQGGSARPYAPHIGMGLYLCKRIVDSLKGTISFESVPGQGTVFNIFVPSS
jgi:light-regulated signal transduction histidine kinase (bacteriophytochrome)